MPNKGTTKDPSAGQREALLETLKVRFEKRHESLPAKLVEAEIPD